MILKIIAYIPAIIGLILIGLAVFLNDPKRLKNRIFAAFNLISSLWLTLLFISDTTSQEIVALWALRFALMFGQLVPLMLYYLVLVFPYTSSVNRRKQIIVGSLYGLFSALALTKLNVISVEILDYGVLPVDVGPLYDFSDLMSLALVFLSLVVLIKKYKRTREVNEKNQLKIMLIATLIVGVTNAVTGIVLLRIVQADSILLLLGNFAVLIFSILVAYAIIKHRFFDIRFLVARSVGYILSTLSIGLMVGIFVFVFADQAIRLFSDSAKYAPIVYAVLAIVLSFTFNPLLKYFNRKSNQLFYQDAYDSQDLLNEFNQAIVSTIDLRHLLSVSGAVIEKYIKVEFCLFAINSNNSSSPYIVSTGDATSNSIDIREMESLMKSHESRVVKQDELDDKKVLKEKMRKLNISMAIAMKSEATKRNIGYVFIGYKKSGNLFNSQDTNMLEITSNELAIAVQNALQYEEIKQFNVTLQAKVDDATRKLRRTNEKLKALDETKDEFISMASHQLRTPLTSVKGYVSMVLDGDAGKVSKQQQKLLDQAFISSQRMVYLIADLLNVSRLRTGKFVIEAKPTNLADVIEGEVTQLVETAKGRDLTLSYHKPKDFPTLNLDETKTRQVIMNFIDNAIYYTPAGGHITINLEDKGSAIEYTVVDDGIGVPKAEQHHLFSKFYRAGNAKKARPDGTGLGLFMAKKVIVAQGGSVIFKSQEGNGSTFGFSFPKAKLQAVTMAKATEKSTKQQ